MFFAIGIGIIAVFVVIMLCMGYVKAKPDEAKVISGLRKSPKILVG